MLPLKYKNSKSILNIQNEDNFCFLWCILAHNYPADNNKNRVSNYTAYWSTLNIDGLDFPMCVKDTPKIEGLNNLNKNVFKLDKVLSPVYINSNYTQPQIDLLFYENHFWLITKLHSLINKHMKNFCRRCLTAFSSEQVLLDYMERCIKQKPANIGFKLRDHIQFEDYQRKFDLLFRVYTDFECLNTYADAVADAVVEAPNGIEINMQGLMQSNVLYK